jgi:hypothetical protein
MAEAETPSQQNAEHAPKFPLGPVLFHVVCGLACALLTFRYMAPSLWWLGFVFWQALALGWREELLRPWRLYHRLGPSRLNINLSLVRSSAHHQPLGSTWPMRVWLWEQLHWPPFVFRAVVMGLVAVLIMGPHAIAESQLWGGRFQKALTPQTLRVTLEPPTHTKASASTLTLRQGSRQHEAVVSGTLLDLSLHGGEGWRALVAANDPNSLPYTSNTRGDAGGTLVVRQTGAMDGAPLPTPVTLPLDALGSWSGSTDRLAELVGLQPGVAFDVALDITTTEGRTFGLDLRIDPSPVPVVALALAAAAASDPSLLDPTAERDNSASEPSLAEQAPLTLEQGELLFAARAQSETPLTQVELQVRTESGYRFTMPIGEFAGTDRLTFSSDNVRLQTIGIPFAAKDVLYVRARAQTFVKGLEGFSAELKFPVISPQETRRALREQLEAIRESLKQRPKADSAFRQWKSDLNEGLQQASQSANQLGRQSAPARALGQARDLAQRMTQASESQVHAIDARVRDALEALKRQEAQEQTSSWFMKMKNFLDRLDQADLSQADVRKSLSSDGQALRDEAAQMKDALRDMIDSPKGGLKLDEKQMALQALQRDQTPESMASVNGAIEAGSKGDAAAEGRQALEDATQNLGSILQLLASARARNMREARERLERADEQLEGARQSDDRAQQQKASSGAERDLEGTPQLGEAFNEALAEAQDGAKGLSRAVREGQGSEEVRAGLDRTQRAIANALAALQDEEQSERDERGQEEGRRYRSAMDAMNAQGQLDSGWRKKIFEEISRLREQGVPADSELIRYLESRLR